MNHRKLELADSSGDDKTLVIARLRDHPKIIMHIMLAEDIGGWLEALVAMMAAYCTSVLALIGLAPAIRRKRVFTIAMIVPALIAGVVTSSWLVRNYLRTGARDHETWMENVVETWFFMGAPPFAAALITGSVLCYQTWRRN
jgi:hypothetical protein